ncbi:TIGR03759 family integrating conjugative element protein [Erwinia sp. ACCC 02193]|uniref:TIGR03759 family integrating conjugative element protein n=1 Tax=Erwinia aeris TaxID=3239803 RepID=A0ABV4ECW7_9GAMM
MKIKTLILLLLTCGGTAYASVQTTDTQGQATDAQRTGQSAVQDLQQQAGQWGLNQQDYQRYQQLMNGPRGTQSPGLDPLSTLGIEARSAEERRQYAEKWVKQEFARTQKEMEFQREVNSAWQRLYPDTLAVNMGNAAGIAHDTGGRLALFVKSVGCAQCDARLSAVLADNRPVDIYLVDSQGDDDTLRSWAKAHHIPLDRVRSHQITLNHDGGRWIRFGSGLMPVVLQQGENGWQIAAY